MDVFGTAELVFGEEREVWSAVGHVECLGEMSVMDGEREERALDAKRLHDATWEDVDVVEVEGSLVGDGI